MQRSGHEGPDRDYFYKLLLCLGLAGTARCRSGGPGRPRGGNSCRSGVGGPRVSAVVAGRGGRGRQAPRKQQQQQPQQPEHGYHGKHRKNTDKPKALFAYPCWFREIGVIRVLAFAIAVADAGSAIGQTADMRDPEISSSIDTASTGRPVFQAISVGAAPAAARAATARGVRDDLPPRSVIVGAGA